MALSELLLVNLVMAQTAFAADYTGPESSIRRFLCAPTVGNTGTTGNITKDPLASVNNTTNNGAASNNTAAGDLYVCINRIYRFAIILASVGAVLYIVVAGYMYMSSEGNSEMVDKAKSYVSSAITAIVILLVGYILLKALNPDLIQFHNIQPPSVIPATTTPPTDNGVLGGGGGPVASNVKDAATSIQNLANAGKLNIASTGCDCANNCAINTIQSLAAGNQAQVDGPIAACNVTKTTVSVIMLNALISTANSGHKFSIGSITGGHHANSSDPHYLGRAVDLTPLPATVANQQSIIQDLYSGGANLIALECEGKYLTIPDKASPTDNTCIGKSNYHIHAQWP